MNADAAERRRANGCSDRRRCVELAGKALSVWYRRLMNKVPKKSKRPRSQPAAMARNDRRLGPGATGWIVTKNGSTRASGIYGTQAEAARAAQEMVRIKGGTVRTQGPDGRLHKSFTIGRDGFAKISAVEGLRLSREKKQDLRDFDRKGVSDHERGRAMVRKYGRKPV